MQSTNEVDGKLIMIYEVLVIFDPLVSCQVKTTWDTYLLYGNVVNIDINNS